MLKKAGIVVAAGAATLLAVSPLAFAGDSGEHGEGGSHHHGASNIAEKNSKGLVNVSGNNLDLSPQTCLGNVASGNNLIQGVLGLAGQARNTAVESSVENNQDQSVNCTNASQAGDNVSQNEGSDSDSSDWGSK